MEQEYTPTGLPRTVSNPLMGVDVTFLKSSEETGGEYVETQVSIPAGHQGPPRHFHLDFEETFTTVKGTLVLDRDDVRGIRLRPGESVTIEPKVEHRYYNTGDEDTIFSFVARPGLAYERGIRAGFGLARDGLTNAQGVPRNLLDLALVFELSGSYVTGAPLRLQKALARVGVRLARLCGHDLEFSAYTKSAARPAL